MTAAGGEVLEFLDFVLDPAAVELRRSGSLVDIEPQVFDLIAFLAAHPGQVVTRDQLFMAVWQGRIVTDSTISSRVNAARRALGDDGRTQAIIKTVHGRGFRFEARPVRIESRDDGRPADHVGPGASQFGEDRLEWPDKPSVAVLPFDAHGREERHEFFADGLTDDVIIGLSRLRALFVIARNSSFSYKNKRHDTVEISRDLGVRYLVVGGVRFAKDKVRASAQLVDASTGRQVWSDTIDRELVDMLVAQEDVARGIVSSVQTQILLNEGEISEHKSRARQRVSDLLNRAWRTTADWTKEGLAAAHELATEARERDPLNPRVHVVIALAHYGQAYLGYVNDPAGHLDDALTASLEAVRLAPNDEYVHWITACSCWCRGEHDRGIRHAQRAIEISPNFSWAHGTMGTALAWSGRFEDAIAKTEIALRYNPRDSTIYFRHLVMALSHYGLERYEEALGYAERVIHQKPDWFLGHVFKIASLVCLDRPDDAQRAVSESRCFLPPLTPERIDALPFSDDRDRAGLRTALDRAGAFGAAKT